MADLNYVNPMSLKPEIGWAPKNALAGMMYHQNNEDYRRAFEQQMRLQDLGEQERKFDFGQKQLDAPVKDLERQLKSNTMQGQIPMAGEVAASGQRTQLAKDAFDQRTTYGPEAIRTKLREYTKNFDDAQWDKFMKENQYAAQLLEQAIAIKKQRGITEAIGYVDQRKKELEEQGFRFPQHFQNPLLWDSFYDAALNSIKMGQEERLIKEKGNQEVRARETSGRFTVQAAEIAARARTDSASKPFDKMKDPEKINYLENKISAAVSSGNDDDLDQIIPMYKNLIERRFNETVKSISGMGTLSPEIQQKIDTARVNEVNRAFENLGIRIRPPSPGPAAPGPQGATPAPNTNLKSKYGLE